MTKWLALIALAVPSLASAQNFDVHPSMVLVAQEGTFYETGLGSPTVAYDAALNDFVMFFETRLPAWYLDQENIDGSACANGAVWGIGWAVSPDGVNGWTVQGDHPLIIPQTGEFYSCQAAHPNVVKDGAAYRVFFKAEQAVNPCPTGSPAPSWGCDRQVGVGLATFERSTGVASINSAPVLTVSGFGFPSVVKVDNVWQMWLAKVPSLYLATSTSPSGPFTLGSSPVVDPGTTTWTPDRVFNPASVCYNGSRHPYTIMLGGKQIQAPSTILAGGWGATISPDGKEWYTAAEPQFMWDGNLGFRHWDVLRVAAEEECESQTNDDFVMWFSERNSTTGKNEIGFAYTSSTWNRTLSRSKICSSVGATSLTDAEPFSMDFADTGAWAPAGCSSTGTAPVGWLGLPLLLLGLRRRSNG